MLEWGEVDRVAGFFLAAAAWAFWLEADRMVKVPSARAGAPMAPWLRLASVALGSGSGACLWA